MTPFTTRLAQLERPEYLRAAERPNTLQVNVGLRCNLSCVHCHLSCGPARNEVMGRETMEACLRAFAQGPFTVFDITGGAPELNPWSEWLTDEAASCARQKNATVIMRTNATLLSLAKYAHVPQFWAERGVEVTVSLPCYTQSNTDAQRGSGTYERALEGLRKLGDAGYGRGESNAAGQPLILNLVYNPGGAFLPGEQGELESDYRSQLPADISFDHLLTITNNPAGRFKDWLEEEKLSDEYACTLEEAFNPESIEPMMCRHQVNVGWDGTLYDCDFNQALGLSLLEGQTIAELASGETTAASRRIRFGNHCYACTAGAGSSCTGATVA